MKTKITKLRTGRLTPDSNEILQHIKDQKEKLLPGKAQTWCRTRKADGLILGAARAYYLQRTPRELVKKAGSIPFPELQDREHLTFIMQVLAYAHKIDEAGKIKELKEKSHEILGDLSGCITITEEYFNGGWSSTAPDIRSFKEIVSSSYPDTEVMQDLKELIEEESDENDENDIV